MLCGVMAAIAPSLQAAYRHQLMVQALICRATFRIEHFGHMS
jgi:hypothetical protein